MSSANNTGLRNTGKAGSSKQLMDQLSKVAHRQMLASPRKASTARLKQQKRLLALSPFLKADSFASPPKTARSTREDRSDYEYTRSRRLLQCEVETGIRKVADVAYARLRESVGQLRRYFISAVRKTAEAQSTRFDSQVSQYNSFLSLTECPQCHHVGVSLLTTSTKDQFSPKFLRKIRALLPGSGESSSKSDQKPKEQKTKNDKGKDLGLSMEQYEEAELQDIPDISGIHMDSFSASSSVASELASEDRGIVSAKSPDSKNLKFDSFETPLTVEVNLTDIPSTQRWGYKVPRLNFSCVHSPVKALSRVSKSREKRRSKPGKHLSRIEGGVELLRKVVLARVQRAFYITLLSRSRQKQASGSRSARPSLLRAKVEKVM